MNGDNHLHLEVRDILQHIKNAIDNEALWIKHYKNLREIEKDLPEDSQEAKSLDELLISDFLYLELKIYGISDYGNKNTMKLVISKIKDIEKFIPMVFNFKERLKLVLCAVSHMDKGLISLEQTNYHYGVIVNKFKTLDEIDMLEDIINVPEDHSQQPSDNITMLNDLLTSKHEIVDAHEKLVESVKNGVNKKSRQGEGDGMGLRSHNGGSGGAPEEILRNNSSHNIDIDINEFFRGISTLNTKNPLKELIDSYNLEDKSDDDKIYMFQNFVWINFSRMNQIDHIKQLEMLNNGFKSYIDNTPLSDEIKSRVKSSMDEFDGFALFKKFLPRKSFNQNWFVKYFEQHAPILSLILGKVGEEYDGGVEEAKGEEAAAAAAEAAKLQEVFNKYIEKVFEYLYAKLLIDKNIIGEEIKHQKQVEEQNHRSRENISSDFKSAKDPLLRMFLSFVSECVHDMSSKISKLSVKVANSFWDNLENNFPNKISLQDEIVNGTSLFNNVKSELEKKSGGTDEQKTVIDGLVIKSKLIYLLQNYHYF